MKHSYSNEFIRKRRKKKFIKKSIFLLIVLTLILITLCLKLTYFNVKNIVVLNNTNVTKKEIIKLSNIHTGNNIFYMNTKQSEKDILLNPYILEAVVKRKLPNIIQITVKEREAAFYNKKGKKIVIIDKHGVALEEKDNIKNMKLIKLEGMDFEKSEIGKELKCDDKRKIKFIGEITDLITRMNENVPVITLVDINSMIDIKVYFGNMVIIMGNSNDFESKLNKAINILCQNNMKNSKGYIDVSFNGNPVVFVEK